MWLAYGIVAKYVYKAFHVRHSYSGKTMAILSAIPSKPFIYLFDIPFHPTILLF